MRALLRRLRFASAFAFRLEGHAIRLIRPSVAVVSSSRESAQHLHDKKRAALITQPF